MIDYRRLTAGKFKTTAALTALIVLVFSTFLFAQSADPWPAKDVLQPAALAKILKGSSEKPLILQVGFPRLYREAHIPGSPQCGPARSPDGIKRLKSCLAKVPKTRSIVLYCGCCPWHECPNIRPAYRAVKAMGYRNVKVLYLAHNFGQNWVKLAYPTTR